jgi:hypothetical protein
MIRSWKGTTMKLVRFEDLPPGVQFKMNSKRYPDAVFTKLEQPDRDAGRRWGTPASCCGLPAEEIWNAWNGNTTVHFCPGELVVPLPPAG